MQFTLLKKSTAAAAAIAAVLMAGGGQAATVDLDSTAHCNGTESTQEFFKNNGDSLGEVTIKVGDVTGTDGAASDCWGAFKGNDSQQTGTATDGTSNFRADGMLYSFVSKKNMQPSTGDGMTGIDIGLTVSPSSASTTGSWSVDAAKFAPYGDFLISLKAANNPGYAVWLFSGEDAASTAGDWEIAWGQNLSHISIYAKDAPDVIPLPAAGWLLLAGIGGLAAFRRRKSV